jgi:hypothetical protein
MSLRQWTISRQVVLHEHKQSLKLNLDETATGRRFTIWQGEKLRLTGEALAQFQNRDG